LVWGDAIALARCVNAALIGVFHIVRRSSRAGNVGETSRLRSPAIRHIKRHRIMLAVRVEVMHRRVPSARCSATCHSILRGLAGRLAPSLKIAQRRSWGSGSYGRFAQTKGFFCIAHELALPWVFCLP
jgi:hypothetical protein